MISLFLLYILLLHTKRKRIWDMCYLVAFSRCFWFLSSYHLFLLFVMRDCQKQLQAWLDLLTDVCILFVPCTHFFFLFFFSFIFCTNLETGTSACNRIWWHEKGFHGIKCCFAHSSVWMQIQWCRVQWIFACLYTVHISSITMELHQTLMRVT